VSRPSWQSSGSATSPKNQSRKHLSLSSVKNSRLRANKKCLSLPVSASYGFEDATGEVKLKIAENDNNRIEPKTVTVMLSEETSQKTVGVYLLDATTGAELAAPLTIDVAISM
jgi:hypothetical protein